MKLALLFLLVPSLAFAAPAARKSCVKCPPAVHCPPSHRCETPAVPSKPALNAFQEGFEVTFGFRWDRIEACPTLEEPKPEPEYCDPTFIGVQQRIPLNKSLTLQARLDRDIVDNSGNFIQAPHWNGAVQLNWAPWK